MLNSILKDILLNPTLEEKEIQLKLDKYLVTKKKNSKNSLKKILISNSTPKKNQKKLKKPTVKIMYPNKIKTNLEYTLILIIPYILSLTLKHQPKNYSIGYSEDNSKEKN